LEEIAGQLNPIHAELFGDFDLRYHWSVHQSEWATDLMFKDPGKLAGLYPQFLRHGLTTSLGALTEKLCRPTTWKGQRVRALNPYGPADLALLKAVARGEFNINGFRNRDLAKFLYAADQELTATEKRRQSSAITRKLRLLRAHGLIKKVPKTHRYHLTAAGSKAITAIIAALNASPDSLIKLTA
ncbi:MAG: hypothetical protein ACOZF2_04515, partial [Thermodesulfobacteriota bacterium]